MLKLPSKLATPAGDASGSYAQVEGQHNLSHNYQQSNSLPASVHPRNPSNTAWTPRSLSTPALLASVGLFASFTVVLGLLYHFAIVQDGLHIISTSHYTWVYGPTAVLVLLVSVWRQIDFHTKSLVAWSELKHGNAMADRSILLDYTSPTLPTAFYRAARAGHVPVMLTIVAFILLKLATVASTGLFYATDVLVSGQPVDLVKTSIFRGPTFDVSNATIVDSSEDSSVFYMTHAIMNLGLPRPEGVAEGVLYETFGQSNTSKIENATFEAYVQGFYPNMTCTPFKVAVNLSSDAYNERYPQKQFRIVSEDDACRWKFLDSPSITACEIDTRSCPSRRIYPIRQTASCDGDSETDVDLPGKVLFSLVEMRYNQTWNGTAPIVGEAGRPSNWTFDFPNTNAVLCKLSYSIKPTRVVYRTIDSEPRIEVYQTEALEKNKVTGFTYQQMASQFHQSVRAAFWMFSSHDEFVLDAPDSYFGLMKLESRSIYDDFLKDSALFARAAENVFSTLGVQIGRKFLSNPSHEILKGTIEFHEQRLLIQKLSLGFVLTGFLLLVVIAVLMMFLRPIRVTQDSSTSIAYIAHVIRHSSVFRQQLQAAQRGGRSSAKQVLRYARYSSMENKEKNALSIVGDRIVSNSPLQSTDIVDKWWRPTSLSWPFLAWTGLSAVAVISILEWLQHISDRSEGLFILHNPTSAQIGAYTRFLPALVMLGVATMYNSLDFNALLLAPFGAMKARPTTKNVVSESLLAKMPPIALYTAFKHRQWAACLTTIATLIGSALTIVVSGLYTFEPISTPSQQTLRRLDSWNTNFADSFSTDNSSSIVLSVIESNPNYTYPVNTHIELAFPSLGADLLTNDMAPGFLTARLPALRAKLSCNTISSSDYNITFWAYKNIGPISNAAINVNVTLPASCPKGGPYGNETSLRIYGDLRPDAPFARMISIHVGPYDELQGRDIDENAKRLDQQPDNPPECPSLAFYWGYANAKDQPKSFAKVLYCNQELESIDADITVSVPDLKIVESNPIRVIERSAVLLQSGSEPSNPSTGFPWRIQERFRTGFSVFSINSTVNTTNPGDHGSYTDQFFQGVVYGRTPISNETITDPQKTDLVFEHIHMLYRRYMAQFISSNLRSISTNNQNPAVFQATLISTSGSEQHYIQHRTPKLIIQIMMAVMLLCSVTAYCVGHFHRVVPWNPCSIAGMAVLVADSKICQTEAEYGAGQKLKRPGMNRDGSWSDKSAQSSSVHPIDKSGVKLAVQSSYADQSDGYFGRDEGDVSGNGMEMAPIDVRSTLFHAQYLPISQTSVAYATNANTAPEIHDRSNSEVRYRLGYWRDGVFMGSQKSRATMKFPKSPPPSNGLKPGQARYALDGTSSDTWRYGVDVL